MISLKKKSPKYANSKTIKILIKLLAIKMVANNFFGRSNNVETRVVFLDSSASFKTVFDNEKKATSDPETNADNRSKTKRAIIPIVNDQSMVINKNKLEGSGSNIMLFY